MEGHSAPIAAFETGSGAGRHVAQFREEIIAWVGSQVLPHEADVRAWLRRRGLPADQIDDAVQEAYCRIAALDQVGHIASGRKYLFETARNIVLEQIRRARIVRIDTVMEIELHAIEEDELSPERIASSRRELQRVGNLIAALPERCRRIFELRRINGIPQREIARMLGVTENVVEAQAVRGLKLILKALAGEDLETASRDRRSHEGKGSRARG